MENFDPKSDKIVISIKEFTLIKNPAGHKNTVNLI